MDLDKLSTFYERLEEVVNQLTPDQLLTPVKEGGWTPQQLIHHLADAQAQAFYRIVWLLTEDNTRLKTFEQDDWVDLLGDQPIDGAMSILRGIYDRWSTLASNLDDDDLARGGTHPELGAVTVGGILDYYIDHGESHVAQFAKMINQ